MCALTRATLRQFCNERSLSRVRSILDGLDSKEVIISVTVKRETETTKSTSAFSLGNLQIGFNHHFLFTCSRLWRAVLSRWFLLIGYPFFRYEPSNCSTSRSCSDGTASKLQQNQNQGQNEAAMGYKWRLSEWTQLCNRGCIPSLGRQFLQAEDYIYENLRVTTQNVVNYKSWLHHDRREKVKIAGRCRMTMYEPAYRTLHSLHSEHLAIISRVQNRESQCYAQIKTTTGAPKVFQLSEGSAMTKRECEGKLIGAGGAHRASSVSPPIFLHIIELIHESRCQSRGGGPMARNPFDRVECASRLFFALNHGRSLANL